MSTRSRRARRRGYTLIEVMMAVAIMTAGCVAIMAMHTATLEGNYDARQRTTAVELTSIWIERLHRDAVLWTTGGPGIPYNPLALSRTQYLRNVTALGGTPVWQVPVPPITSTDSAQFDYFGRDTRVGTNMTFCTNIRLQWVYIGSAMRADVRVWSPRTGVGATTRDLGNCGASVSPESLTNRIRDVRFVHASTVLRWTPARATP
jgi:prepilin-type N-terminal cleavage/methylation domain-containing protein